MCWVIGKNTYLNNPDKYRKVAKEDIEVYKFGKVKDESFHPFYLSEFTYAAHTLNDEVELILIESSEYYKNKKFIREGYHSYSSRDKAIDRINKERFLFETTSQVGISIGKFIIPKGTEYYEHKDGSIVSSQLIWTGDNELIH